MALLAQFDTPASLKDAPVGSPFYMNWHNFLAGGIGNLTPGDSGGGFYDTTATDVNVAGEKTLTWMGFPRRVLLSAANRDNKRAAFIAADADPATRNVQDEYFEWFVEKNPAGKIKKVTFVTETPEYFQTLWNTDPALVVNVYKALVNPAIVQADLQSAPGVYNKFNQWNTTRGIVHHIQSINTLGAAILLSEDSVRRVPFPNDNYDVSGLTNTSVDPRVALDVHMLVRKGLHVTLKDPIGLYMVEWNDSGFSKPDGTPVGNYWKIVRGVPGRTLRLEYAVPVALGFVVGDIKIGGHPIEFGGQIAEHITVSITGQAGVRP